MRIAKSITFVLQNEIKEENLVTSDDFLIFASVVTVIRLVRLANAFLVRMSEMRIFHVLQRRDCRQSRN